MFEIMQRYWHTLSPLRAEQLVGQVWTRMRPLRRWVSWLQQFPPSPYPGCRAPSVTPWLEPPNEEGTREAILAGRWCFLHDSKTIGFPPDWSASDASKLWQYNLHYFEWLWALSWDEAAAVVEDWIAFAQASPESTAMEPYPTSLRLMNWCGYFFHRHLDKLSDAPRFCAMLWQSLHTQAEALCARLEYHLLGNHLFENAAALALLGSRFLGEDAARWRGLGFSLLQRELPEQILPDGMHFERSPMYHLRMTAVVMLLAEHGDDAIRSLAARYLPSMQDALRVLCHPDGQIALFNDSAFGIYHEPSVLLVSDTSTHTQKPTPSLAISDAASALLASDAATPCTTDKVWALEDAGYYGAQTSAGSYVICDAGLIGPDYLPGHAHGDTFSFELSLRHQRIIVDSGVYDYRENPMRRYMRSTRAHNTVEIEGVDQSAFWGAFRVAERARPHDLLWKPHDTGFSLQAWHDGYLRLPQQARHERRFDWSHTGRLMISDQITAQQPVSVVARLHLHPACAITHQDEHAVTLDTPVGRVQIRFFGDGAILPKDTEESWYGSHFGRAIPNSVVCFRAGGSSLSFRCVIDG